MKVFDKNKVCKCGKLGLCAKMAAIALVVLAFRLVGCKQSVGGGAPDVPAPAPIRNPVPPAPEPILDSVEPETEEDDESLGLNTYKFFVDGYQIGSAKGVKLPGEVTFAQILEKASLDESNYLEANFEGWKDKNTGITISDDTVLSNSTDFEAMYKAENKYRESVSMEDLVNCAWYSESEKAFLILSGNGDMAELGFFDAIKIHSEGNSIFDIMLALETAKQYFALVDDHKGSKNDEWEAINRKIDGPDWFSLLMDPTTWKPTGTTDIIFVGGGFMWPEVVELVMDKTGEKLYDKNSADTKPAYIKVNL